jgi:glycosyltransferase involved in cell wall biosynthesis
MKLYVNRVFSNKNSVEIFLNHLLSNCRQSGISLCLEKDKWDVELACIEEKNDKMFLKGPVIQRLDGIYLNTENDLSSNIPIKKTFNKCSGVIYQSNLCKKVADINFGKKDKFSIIHNGTTINEINDIDSFFEKNYNNIYSKIKDSSNKIICVAKWRKVKRLPSIINGFQEYRKKDSKSILIVIGDYKLENINNLNLENILFLNKIQNEHIKYFQTISNVCLNLSFTDACPNAVIEALSYGTPCLITEYQGVAEIINKNGFILDYDKWDYKPFRFSSIKEIPSYIVADGIMKCLKIGKHPIRYDLDIKNTFNSYIGFLKQFLK